MWKHALKHRLSPTSVGAIAEYSAHPYTAPPFVPMGRVDAFSVAYVVDGPAFYDRWRAGCAGRCVPAVQPGQQPSLRSPLCVAGHADLGLEREGRRRLAAQQARYLRGDRQPSVQLRFVCVRQCSAPPHGLHRQEKPEMGTTVRPVVLAGGQCADRPWQCSQGAACDADHHAYLAA